MSKKAAKVCHHIQVSIIVYISIKWPAKGADVIRGTNASQNHINKFNL